MEMLVRHQKRHDVNDLEAKLNDHADYNKYLMQIDPEAEIADYSDIMDV